MAELSLMAVVVIKFKVEAEFTSDEELLRAMDQSPLAIEHRNNVTRKIEKRLRLSDGFPWDTTIGWIDGDRDIHIGAYIEEAKVRGLAKAPVASKA